MEDLRVKDVSNLDNVRTQSRAAMQDILAIIKVADYAGVKPAVSDLAKFIQPAKQYFFSFKEKRSETLSILVSIIVGLIVAFLIKNNAFHFTFHFLNKKLSIFLDGFVEGLVIFSLLAFIHYFLDKDRSETAYIVAMLGHLSPGDNRYIEPIRQLLFDDVENNFEKVEYYNWYLVGFLILLGAFLSGLSYLNQKLIVLVFIIAFFVWFGNFNVKKIKKEKK